MSLFAKRRIINMPCLFHKWNYCKCEKCGKVREKPHKIETINCITICQVCGKILSENHDFPDSDDCYLKCKNCDVILPDHEWDEFKCEKCGKNMSVGDMFINDVRQFISEKAKEHLDKFPGEKRKQSMIFLSESIMNPNQIIDDNYCGILIDFISYYENWFIKNDYYYYNKYKRPDKAYWDYDFWTNDGYRSDKIRFSLSATDILSVTMNAIYDISIILWNKYNKNNNEIII